MKAINMKTYSFSQLLHVKANSPKEAYKKLLAKMATIDSEDFSYETSGLFSDELQDFIDDEEYGQMCVEVLNELKEEV